MVTTIQSNVMINIYTGLYITRNVQNDNKRLETCYEANNGTTNDAVDQTNDAKKQVWNRVQLIKTFSEIFKPEV